MSEDQAPAEKVSEEVLDNALEFSADQLSLTERQKLSLALFPETHTKTVPLLGKERLLRPLTIKYSRRVNELLKPYMETLEKTAVEGTEESKNGVPPEKVISYLFSVLKALCEFYGEDWNDVKIAIADEDVALAEMESVVVNQAHLNTVNDFLLVPLRTMIRMLQLQEIRNVRLESLANTFISLLPLNSGDAPLTTSSQSTQQDS